MSLLAVSPRRRLEGLLSLARRDEPVLSLHLEVDSLRPTQENLRLRVRSLLEKARETIVDPPLVKVYEAAATAIEGAVPERLAEQGMVLFATGDEGLLTSTFLPVSVRDFARFGPGADVMPIVDALDEMEPVVVCHVERNSGLIMVVEQGEIVSQKRVSSEVPRRTRSGAPTFVPHYQQHQEEFQLRHMRRLGRQLEKVLAATPSRRVYLAGPTKQVASFQTVLGKRTTDLVLGTLRFPGYAPAAKLRDAAVDASAVDERQEEEEKVAELVTRGLKNQQAALGPYATTYAVQEGRAHELVISGEMDILGRRCAACGHVGPVEESRCPVCQGPMHSIDLAHELVILAVRNGIGIEVVHWKASDDLEVHGGVGAFLRLD